MSVISSLMTSNIIGADREISQSRYVKNSLSMREMEAADKLDQTKMVATLAKKPALAEELAEKAPNARTLARIRASQGDEPTYTAEGAMKNSAGKMATDLVTAVNAELEAKYAPEEGTSNIGNIGILDGYA